MLELGEHVPTPFVMVSVSVYFVSVTVDGSLGQNKMKFMEAHQLCPQVTGRLPP
jgi:hypothetical protein